MVSLPSRGAWIETRCVRGQCAVWRCRSLRGERGLKLGSCGAVEDDRCRSLRGERGLKLAIGQRVYVQNTSLPSRGAWIETMRSQQFFPIRSLPSRGAWIETMPLMSIQALSTRRSLRGERGLKHNKLLVQEKQHNVAPFAGSVD